MNRRRTTTPVCFPHSLFLTRSYCNCVTTTILRFIERHWISGYIDSRRHGCECEKQFFTCDGNNVNSGALQLSLSGKTKRYRKYTLILSFIAFSTTIYGLAIETECKSNPPWPFFIWLLKRCCWFTIGKVLFVLFCAVCREQRY